MSTSMYIDGFKSETDEYRKMKAIYDACEAAGVETPDAVDKYFGIDGPGAYGKAIDLSEAKCVKKFSEDGQCGYDVDITKLPKDIKIIRFYLSY